MDISYNWLREYVDFDLTPAEVAKILNSIGLEVETMEEREEIPGGLQGVVVAEVLECKDHPDSDHLHVTKVDAGAGEPLQVVCGAPNVAAGQKVMLATINTKLHFSNGEEVKIKKSKIRGVESFGMLCAEDELGVGTDHEGIMVLPDDAAVGTPAKEYFKLESDTVFGIGLTPNRIDAASHIGVARDLSAYLKLNGLGGQLRLPSVEGFSLSGGKEGAIGIDVVAKEGAPRYTGLTIRGVKVGESPAWMKKRLLSVGQRPINLVVDVTNFILMEMGQPMHAFDADKIEGGKVVVRFADDQSKFTTLDGVERTLSKDDLMICNTKAPMCIAGVFGGLESGVTGQTANVFLESAYFNPVCIRKTSKRHALKTEASFRYERGCDPMITDYAIKRAAMLIQEYGGGSIVGDIIDVQSAPLEKKIVELSYGRMESLIGKKIGHDTIRNILTYLDMEILSETPEGAVVAVPAYRVDVYRECDVVEDVLRIYGYDNVEIPPRVTISVNTTQKPDPERVRMLASEFMAANGFMEIMNNSLTRSEYYADLTTYPQQKCVMLLNPLSSDLNCMRQTLIFNGLEVVAHNINRQSNDLKLFEIGNVYSYNAEYREPEVKPEHFNAELKHYSEEQHFALFISGPGSKYWHNKTAGGDFFTLKGYLELLLKKFSVDIADLEYEAAPADLFAEGLTYKVNSKTLAVVGTVSAKRLKEFGIKQAVYAAEINWNLLLKLVAKNRIQYRELPKYPEVRRDLALLLDADVSFAQIRKCAFATEKKLLKSVALFDVYTGDKIPEGKKQYAVSFVLQDNEKTLTDKVVESVMEKLLQKFAQEFGAQLR